MYQEKGLNILRAHSPYGQPLEYHCLRVAQFALALARHEHVVMDPDLTHAACYLHDIGLCAGDPADRSYLKRGRNFAMTQIDDWQLDEAQTKILEDTLLYNHSLVQIPGISIQADLVRRAVSVEHSLGALHHGLDRSFIKAQFRSYPRAGFNSVLLSFARTTIVDDSWVELFRIWFPRRAPH